MAYFRGIFRALLFSVVMAELYVDLGQKWLIGGLKQRPSVKWVNLRGIFQGSIRTLEKTRFRVSYSGLFEGNFLGPSFFEGRLKSRLVLGKSRFLKIAFFRDLRKMPRVVGF